jgi:hypothetical protein
MHDPHDEVGLHLLPDDERHAGLLLLIRRARFERLPHRFRKGPGRIIAGGPWRFFAIVATSC